MIDSFGVPKHSDFEPDYFLAKGDGNVSQKRTNSICTRHVLRRNRQK